MRGVFHSNAQTLQLGREISQAVSSVPEAQNQIQAARLRREYEATPEGRFLARQTLDGFEFRLRTTVLGFLRGGRKEG